MPLNEFTEYFPFCSIVYKNVRRKGLKKLIIIMHYIETITISKMNFPPIRLFLISRGDLHFDVITGFNVATMLFFHPSMKRRYERLDSIVARWKKRSTDSHKISNKIRNTAAERKNGGRRISAVEDNY